VRFVDLARIVLEPHDEHVDVLRLVDRRIGLERLREDLDRAQRITRPQGNGHLDLLIDGAGAAGRKLLAAVIASIEFKRAGTDDDELLAALRMIAELSGTARRWLPGFSSAFIDQQRRPDVVDVSRGRLDSCASELCATAALGASRRPRLGAGQPPTRRPGELPAPEPRSGNRPERRSPRRSSGRCRRWTVSPSSRPNRHGCLRS
jgi:hypothetical protein